jgi:signal peptidase I
MPHVAADDPQPPCPPLGNPPHPPQNVHPVTDPAPDTHRPAPPAPGFSLPARLQDTPSGRFVEITQTVLTGLILAFMFRAFFVEPFIIPTGSMAPTLLGAHATTICPACGWEFNYAPQHESAPGGVDFVAPPRVICPNCQLHIPIDAATVTPRSGDRILVNKWAYALGGILGPRRWDVIVFRDPANPNQHYIKRLVGLPGESVEIVDGDVYIDGRIARKPRHVQDALWMVVFDQSHLPRPTAESGLLPRWRVITPGTAAAPGWTGIESRVIRYIGLDETPRELAFNPDAGRYYLSDLVAYNRGATDTLVGDVRLIAEVTFHAGTGTVRWVLTRRPDRIFCEISREGLITLGRASIGADESDEIIAQVRRGAFPLGQPITIEFGHVDYRAYVRVNDRPVLATTDDQYHPDLDNLRNELPDRPVGLYIQAVNLDLTLRGVRIDRDVHYLSQPRRVRRAQPGAPFQLGDGEYFVLGDNSPDSHDSREWTQRGPHLPLSYRIGTVPADQIVGQAAFVYLPSLLPLGEQGRVYVPDLGRVRFVR